MFSPVPMRQMRVVVLDRDRRPLLQELGRLGVMHLMHAPAESDGTLLAPSDRTPEREQCRQLLARIRDLCRNLGCPVEPEAADATAAGEPPALGEIEARLAEHEAALAALTDRQRALQARGDQLGTVIEQLASFREVDLPFDALDRFSFLHFAIGTLPDSQLDPLRARLADNVVLVPLPRGGARRAVMAVTSRTGRFALETALRQAGFQAEAVPAAAGMTTAMLLEESREARRRADEERRQIQLARVGLAASAAPQLQAMARTLAVEGRMLEAEEQLPRTQQTVLVTGWVPEERAAGVTARIGELTRGCCVVETSPASGVPPEQVPVLLRHSRLLQPFAMLVAGYGMPGYREIVPTLFVAVTYMLMFGMMFGDVGHGAVLMLGGGVALWRGRSRKVRDVGTLLVLVGLSSAVFGVVYGSCFGLASFHRHALWHDPIEGNPLGLMAAAIALGVGVISIGLVLNIVNRFRRRDWIGGFLDGYGVAGAVFYWGVLGLLLKYAALRERGLVGLVVVLVVVLPLVAWALREPLAHARRRRADPQAAREGNYLEAAMESVVEAFEAMLGYMANTISFVRLAAYAMSHAAVLMATFVMAREVEKLSAGGGFLSILVIIGGNLVAIVLEGIIAGVQALRLEYYEFFSKFFSGRGQAYVPFSLADKP